MGPAPGYVQDAADAVLCPGYASPELRAVLLRREELGRLVLGNDVWMAAHVLLVLCCRNEMPRFEGGRWEG